MAWYAARPSAATLVLAAKAWSRKTVLQLETAESAMNMSIIATPTRMTGRHGMAAAAPGGTSATSSARRSCQGPAARATIAPTTATAASDAAIDQSSRAVPAVARAPRMAPTLQTAWKEFRTGRP